MGSIVFNYSPSEWYVKGEDGSYFEVVIGEVDDYYYTEPIVRLIPKKEYKRIKLKCWLTNYLNNVKTALSVLYSSILNK